MLRFFLLALAIALLAPANTLASSPPCTPEAIEGGLICKSDDGDAAWQTHHPSLWPSEEAYVAGESGAAPVGPVALDDAIFYAVERDLLRLQPSTGVVRERLRFADIIRQLDEVDGSLEAVLGRAASSSIAIPTDAPPTPQQALAITDLVGLPTTARDANWLAAAAQNPAQAISLLEQAQAIDPTNPFLQQVRGMVLSDEGESDAAARAFAAAAENPDALWRDLLQLSTELEELGIPAKASLALEQGMAQMEAFGIGEQELMAFLPMAAAAIGSSEEAAAIMAAIQRGDPAEAYRLALGYARDLPIFKELSAEWERLLDENRLAAYEVVEEAALDLDSLLLALATGLLSLILLTLLAGLRIGATRRVRLGDILLPALLFAGLVLLPYLAMPHVHVAQSFADLPIDQLQQDPTSPEARQQLFELADDPIIQQFLNALLDEQQAKLFGDQRAAEDLPERIPLVRLLADAAYLEAEAQKWDLLHQGQMPDYMAYYAMASQDPVEWTTPEGISLAYALIPAAALLLLALIAALIGRLFPKLIRPILLALPGGATTLTTLSTLVLVALIAAILALAGLDSLIQQRGLPEVAALLELDDVPPADLPSRTWAYLTLAAATVAHLGLLALQIRAQRQP